MRLDALLLSAPGPIEQQTQVDQRSLKVCFLTVMPSPYTQDLFDAMWRDGRIQPRVLYLEMAAPDTFWGNVPLPDYATVLPGFWLHFLGGRVHFNRGAFARSPQSRLTLSLSEDTPA